MSGGPVFVGRLQLCDSDRGRGGGVRSGKHREETALHPDPNCDRTKTTSTLTHLTVLDMETESLFQLIACIVGYKHTGHNIK